MADRWWNRKVLEIPSEFSKALVITESPKSSEASLVAAAKRLTSTKADTSDRVTRLDSNIQPEQWQNEAWEMFNLVGELRYLATAIAARMGQARLYIGKINQDSPSDDPIEQDHGPAVEAFASLGSPTAIGQLVKRYALNRFIAGDGWLVGIPKYLLPGNPITTEPATNATTSTWTGGNSSDRPTIHENDLPEIEGGEALEWCFLSVEEIKAKGRRLTLNYKGRMIECAPEAVWLIRVWEAHPRNYAEADSPVRSSMSILRELVGLTMHVSAQIDSRLAGAGVLIVPQSAKDAVMRDTGGMYAEGTDYDPFLEAMMEAMMTAIQDRSSAAAKVPMVFSVPDDAAEKFRFMSFASPLDQEAKNLRDEAIRRLALGLDAPPEVLLGHSRMNHWGVWMVDSDTVNTHIVPGLQTFCDAVTTEFLWPILEQQGIPKDQREQYVLWWDVSDIILRPTRSADALNAHQQGVISDKTLRGALGFDESDSPKVDSSPKPMEDPAIQAAIQMVTASPALLANPGLPNLVRQFREVLEGLDGDPIGESPGPTLGKAGGDNRDLPAEAVPQKVGGAEESTSDTGGMMGSLLASLVQNRDPQQINIDFPDWPQELKDALIAAASPVAPNVHVNVKPTPVIIDNAPITVTAAPPTINVAAAAPSIYVEPTPVTVNSPDVKVEVAAPNVKVDAPITVRPTPVKVVQEASKPRSAKVKRNSAGDITEIVQE